jgi:hypothetical protein
VETFAAVIASRRFAPRVAPKQRKSFGNTIPIIRRQRLLNVGLLEFARIAESFRLPVASHGAVFVSQETQNGVDYSQ